MPTVLLILSLIYLAYTFFGYALVISVLARIRKQKVSKSLQSDNPQGSISILLSLHNESVRAYARIRNLLDTDYPKNQIEIIAVSDGSTDGTERILTELARSDSRLNPIFQKNKSGKPASLNAAASVAKGDFLVFADARQQFRKITIPHLISNFADPKVGAVSGELVIEKSRSGTGAGTDVYWRLEKFLRRSESNSGSTVGCTGAVYAIRRNLFSPLPPDTLLDDVVIPMLVAEKGFRVVFDPEAVAVDPQPLTPENERRRKTRTLAGNFQMFFRYPRWLMPWSGKMWWRLISHKYCRLFAPIALLVALGSSAILAFQYSPPIAASLLFWSQISLYAVAVAGLMIPKFMGRIGTIPAAFLFLNVLVVSGFFYFIASRFHGRSGWN